MKVILAGGRKSTGYKELGYLGKENYFYLISKGVEVLVYADENTSERQDIDCIIYTEKDGERLQSFVDISQKFGCNLLNLATGVMDNIKIPENLNFVLVDAPNSNIEVLKTISQIKIDSEIWNMNTHIACITEAHQWSKKSLPGTAKVILDILGNIVLHGKIYSVRSPRFAKSVCGIPEKYLGGFGYHMIEIFEKDTIETGIPIEQYELKVLGRKSYAEGAYEIIGAMKKLPNGQVSVTEMVDKNLL